MPSATAYAPSDRALRDAADSELRARRAAYHAALDYYEGRPRRYVPVRAGEPDDNTSVNLLRQAVDRTVSLLFPAMPALELDADAETEAEARLRQVWAASGGARLLARFARFGALGGHCFGRVIPGPMPRIIALHPANVIAFWQADDVDSVLWYEIHWGEGRTARRQDVVRDGATWRLIDWAGEGSALRLLTEDEWPYPLAPIADWQHALYPEGFYGAGEAGNLALNDRVNRVLTDISRILRYHAAPRTVGVGFEARDVIPTGINNLWTISNPDAKVFNLEMQSDLASSMAAADYLTRAYLAEQRVVIPRADAAEWQRVTNLGIRALFMDMLAKINELRRGYEVGIMGLSQRARLLMGDSGAESVRVVWPEPLPENPSEIVSNLEREIALGIVSRESAARERGRDWDAEQARIRAEKKGNQ